jgi:hypothetical protein
VIDESEINGTKYFNILAGCIELPEKNYMIEAKELDFGTSLNYELAISVLCESLIKFSINIVQMAIIFTDAASYMMKACERFKQLSENTIHFTCFAHLIHNCR